MNAKSHVFEKTYIEYLKQIAGMNFELLADVIGIEVEKGKITIPFFEKPYLVSDKDITDPPANSRRSENALFCVNICCYARMQLRRRVTGSLIGILKMRDR